MRARAVQTTCSIEPPAELVTPAVAKRWLVRQYPALAGLANVSAWPELLRLRGLGLRAAEREAAREGMRSLALDVRTIAAVCGRVVATGRPVPMRFDRELRNHRRIARGLRAVVKYERRWPHRGARTTLRRALRLHERLAAGQPRWWATR